MGLLDDVKKAIGLGTAKKVETKKTKGKKTPKQLATDKGEPWVNVLNIDLDADNPGNGAFELDWNEHFIARLHKAGDKDDNENDMVDRWFQNICRQVVLETYEKDEAMVTRNDIGDGKAEYK
jgi:hypothetical protein